MLRPGGTCDRLGTAHITGVGRRTRSIDRHIHLRPSRDGGGWLRGGHEGPGTAECGGRMRDKNRSIRHLTTQSTGDRVRQRGGLRAVPDGADQRLHRQVCPTRESDRRRRVGNKRWHKTRPETTVGGHRIGHHAPRKLHRKDHAVRCSANRGNRNVVHDPVVRAEHVVGLATVITWSTVVIKWRSARLLCNRNRQGGSTQRTGRRRCDGYSEQQNGNTLRKSRQPRSTSRGSSNRQERVHFPKTRNPIYRAYLYRPKENDR